MRGPFSYYLIGIFFLLSASAVQSRAIDLVQERAYVDDPTATLSLAGVQSLEAHPYTGVLSRGFTRSATWLRVRIAAVANAATEDKLVVRVRPVYLDEIQLFDPLDDSGQPRLTGDRYDWRQSEIESLNHGFVIPAADTPRDLWLRIRTTSSTMVHVEVMPLDQARQSGRFQEILYGLMMGTLVLFFLWAALQWLLRREALVGAFALNQLMAIIYAASYVGYHRILLGGMLEAGEIDRFSWLVYCSYTAIAFVFHYFFAREFRPARWVLWMLAAVGILSYVAELALIQSGEVMLAMRTNITVVTLAPVLMLGIALTCKPTAEFQPDEAPPIHKSALIGFYLLLTIVMWFAAFPILGLSKAPELNLHLFLIHGVMTGVVLIVLLQVRAMRMEDSRNQAYLRERSASQQIEIERQKSKLQGRFMEMLAHELKTSLGVLHMVFGSSTPNQGMLDHGRRTVESINSLIERCLDAEKFSDDEIISHFENFALGEAIADVLSKSPGRERITVHSEVPLVVRTDLQIFRSVLSNLIDNALKYSPPGSQVDIHIRPATAEMRQGVDIAIENLVDQSPGSAGLPDPQQLFKKYYRSEGAHKVSGSGLGLYLVSNFMRLMGGTVRYQSIGTSIRFIVWLPV